MTQHSAGSSNCRRREVHLAGGIAHAAYEVAVGGCDRTLASGKNTHVATQARTARRSGDCAVGVQEDIHQAFLDALTVNLLRCRDFDAGELIHFINTKNEIGKILSSAFDGINVVFGKETDTFTITNSSLILSKYGSDHPMGSFGVIGPIRLDYSKIIPYMEYFSESVSRIIDNMMEEQKGALTDGEKK